ncbi:MAG: hypothetical protein JW954_01815 [Dehalococcoidaceae bacterium]|nr:hypothetical protein [Dehalococcoidaceae bacterium]
MKIHEQNNTVADKPAIFTIIRLHSLKLFVRSAVFIAALAIYMADKTIFIESIYGRVNSGTYLLGAIWIIFFVEMLFRFFPSKCESMGSQKQFARYFAGNGKLTTPAGNMKRKQFKLVIMVAATWIGLNAVVGGLYLTGVIDEGGLLIISMFYAVADIVCILFYCPFQSLIMKNRCCVNCRIYNWDFLMMFTPLLFIRSWYTFSLVAIAILLFIRWEVAYAIHPERFFEQTNKNLGCGRCQEKICAYKITATPP